MGGIFISSLPESSKNHKKLYQAPGLSLFFACSRASRKDLEKADPAASSISTGPGEESFSLFVNEEPASPAT